MRKICKTMRVAVGYALAALTMIAFVLWSAVLVLAPFALLRVIVGVLVRQRRNGYGMPGWNTSGP